VTTISQRSAPKTGHSRPINVLCVLAIAQPHTKDAPIRKKLILSYKKKPKMPEPQRQEARTRHHGNNTKMGPTYANITSE